MKLLKIINESFSAKQKSEMKRLIKHYKEQSLSPDEVQEIAGDELEMLDYSPEEVEVMVPYIVKNCK